MGPIRGILFDLGDTVIDFGPVDTIELFEQGARLTHEYLKRLDQPVPDFHTYHRRQLRAIRWAYVVSRLTRKEFNSLELLGTLSLKMGQELSQPQFQELAWLWYDPLSGQASVEKGLHALLEELGRRGLALAIISNTFIPAQVLDRHLERLDLLRHFPTRVYSCDVRYRKPHPRIFQAALSRLGLPPEQVMLVGDSLKADIFGGNRAGLVTVLKNPADGHSHHHLGGPVRRALTRLRGRRYRALHTPRHTICRLAELPGLLEQYR